MSIFSRRRAPTLVEPSWGEVLSNPDERQSAAAYWRDAVAALDARRTIEPTIGAALLRMVIAYIVADRASVEVLRNSGDHAWRVYLEAAQLATEIECGLGLLPRSRVARG